MREPRDPLLKVVFYSLHSMDIRRSGVIENIDPLSRTYNGCTGVKERKRKVDEKSKDVHMPEMNLASDSLLLCRLAPPFHSFR